LRGGKKQIQAIKQQSDIVIALSELVGEGALVKAIDRLPGVPPSMIEDYVD
jgi:hypothetical protein